MSKPNILFVLTDDLGYGDLGSYGQSHIQTPHLDRMAQEGMRFTQFYAGAPVCAPSRCSLMTGKHNGHGRIRDNVPHGIHLLTGDRTVAEMLQEAGYRTGAIGKWGLGNHHESGAPWKKGFDEFFGHLDQDHAHIYYTDFLWDDDRVKLLYGNRGEKKQQYTHDLFTERALDFIDRSTEDSRPFFLYLAYTLPHFSDYDLQSPESHIVPSDAPYTDCDYPQVEKNYAAMVTRLDRDMGAIFEKLKQLGVDENTLVIFTSDNGPSRETSHDIEFFNSSGPYRGGKRDLTEGGIRVPMLARWPGVIRPGPVTDQIAAFWDVLPTLAEITGSDPATETDGLSFLPTLRGQAQEAQHRYLYWDYGHTREHYGQAVRLGKWKGIRRSLSLPVELYDVLADPRESHDLAATHPELVREVEQLFREALTVSPDYPIAGWEDEALTAAAPGTR